LAPVAVSGTSGSTCIVFVGDEQRDRRACRAAATNAGKNLSAIGLDRHAAAPSVSTLTSLELRRDRVDVDGEAGRHALEHRDERLSVRLASRQKTQHMARILYEETAIFRRAPR
jgi:hypothetical protein